MRKWLIILSLLFAANVQAQYTKGVLTSGTGYGQANNMRMAYGLHYLGATNAYGKKEGWIVYIAGIDKRAPTPSSNTDYDGVDGVADYGVAKLVASNPLPYFQKPGGSPTDLYRWNIIWMVVSTSFATVPFAYPSEAVKLIKANYGATTDTTRIMFVGYSLGAGGGETASKDPYLAAHISFWVNIAGGYNNNNTGNYKTIADSTGPVRVYHSAVDGTASVSISRGYVNGVKGQKPVHPLNYYEFSDLTGTDHNTIRFIMEDTTGGGSYNMTNGDTWTYDEVIYETGLRYTTKRRKRP